MAESSSTPSPSPAKLSLPLRIFVSGLWCSGIVLVFAGLFLTLGASGLSCCLDKPTTTEFPPADPYDVAVDSQGRIYVALIYYGRVQRYSPEGKFETGWHVPVIGVFSLRTTSEGHVQV